jgi:hypothetical protein
MIDKATPGPYKVTIGHRSAAYAIDAPQRKRAGGTNRICSVRPASRRPDAYDEAEANALLLASSWETAAALERVTAERNALVTALEKIAACSPGGRTSARKPGLVTRWARWIRPEASPAQPSQPKDTHDERLRIRQIHAAHGRPDYR